MAEPFSYSTSFVLDKAHFNECFTQSVGEQTPLSAYYKAMLLLVAGGGLILLTDFERYLSWFIFALGVLEGISVYYRRIWWVWRQMLGKSANSEVTLTLDEQAITARSFYVNYAIRWQDVTGLRATGKGWLVEHTGGKNYISDSCLSDEARAFLKERGQ